MFRSPPDRPLLSYSLPNEIDDLQNLRALTRLHLKSDYKAGMILMLRCFRSDRLAFDVKVKAEYSPGVGVELKKSSSHQMQFLGTLHQIELGEVKELVLEGFNEDLELWKDHFLALLKRMPVLARVITGDKNGEGIRSVLDSQAIAVLEVDR